MKVEIDSSRCAGHGSCTMICSSVFELDDDGYGRVVEPNPDERLRQGTLILVSVLISGATANLSSVP